MAYQPYSDLREIYTRKQNWTNADKSGDEEAKRRAAEEAKKYYKSLTDNGYGELSTEMSNAGLERAKQLADQYGMSGKSKVRDYYYSLGKSKGLTKSDIDGLIGWNDATGEITFGGKNVGKPDTVIDGVSYVADTSILDNSFNDYISRAGVSAPKAQTVNTANDDLIKKYLQEYDDIKNQNPFDTEEAKAILGKFSLKGLDGRDNAVASGAGSNGGNIDSFSAANAMRQQQSMLSKGQEAVLAAHQQKLDYIRGLLSDLGVHIDHVYNQDETSKNNESTRDVQTAEVTGKVPTSMLYQLPYYSQFFNADGTLIDPNIDYAAEIEKARKQGNKDLERVLMAARGAKIFGDYSKYGQYAADGDYSLPESVPTEASRQFDEQIAQADRALGAEVDMNTANNNAKILMNESDNKTQRAISETKNKDTASTGGNGTLAWADVDNWVSQYGEDSAENYIKEHYKELGYSNASQALAGYKNHKTQNGAIDADITNSHGDSWIQVGGFGRLSYEELVRLIDAGQIVERYNQDTNSYTYVKAR